MWPETVHKFTVPEFYMLNICKINATFEVSYDSESNTRDRNKAEGKAIKIWKVGTHENENQAPYFVCLTN